MHLHQALVDEGIQAVVQAAHAQAQLLSQLALGQVGVLLQDAHDPKMGVFLDLGLTACHGGRFKVVLKTKRKCFRQATAVPYHDRQCSFGVGYDVIGSDFF